MKKIFTKLMLLAVAATAIVSCVNKFDESTPFVELTQTVTLSAEKPTEVRTELIGGVPYWSKNDQIGVYVVDGDGYKNYAFKNDSESEEPSRTTTFTGQTAVANTLYVYYPYTANGVGKEGAKVDIPANQEPTATSFDGKADIMLAKPVTLDAEGKQVSDLEFARLGAIVKIVLKDKTGNLAGQHVSSLTMTAANNLVGRVYIDVENQELGNLYYGGSKSVTATYTEATQYEVNGTNATYVIVYPQTLAAGSTLSFEAATEGYAISKEITLPSDIELLAGKVTTLNVSLAAENVVAEATGLALPVEDDFAWATGTSGVTPNKEWWSSDFAYTYGNNGELRLGKSGECGHITTSDLNLSEPFTVVVDAKAWTTETSQVAVTAGGVTQKSENLPLEAAGFKTFVFKFDAVGSKEAIKIEITGKRGFIDNLKIVAGHDYVLPPVLTVSTAEISGVSHEGEDKTFTYSVANPVEGVSATVTDNVGWIETAITTADNNGTVTVTVAANDGKDAREGVVTVTYGDLTKKTVTVKQNAKPDVGEEVKTWTLVTNASILAVGDQIIIAAKDSNHALGADKGTNRNAATITKSGNTLENPGADVEIITLEAGKVANTFAFKVSAGYLYAASSSSNHLKTKADLDNNGSWAITIATDGNATIKAKGTYTRNWLRKNSQSALFSCYGSGQNDVVIYRLSGSNGGGDTPETPATPVLSITPTTLNFDAAAGSKTIECTIDNEVSGVNVNATESVDWLSTSVSGKIVTVTATENTTTSERTATVTISYQGAQSQTVTVSQAAGNAGGGTTDPEPPTAKTYTFTITKADFNTSSYDGNNNEKTSTATASDGSTMEVKWTSYQVMNQSSTMQWQKNKGCIYNSTDLGTINSVDVSSTAGSFTKYINSSKQPTSNGTGGYFQIKVGNATGKVESITVKFTK